MPKNQYVYTEKTPSYEHKSVYSLYISPSTIKAAGYGVFTHGIILKNTFIDTYRGDYQSIPTSKYYFSIRDNFGIDAGNYPRCYMAMLNDVVNSDYKTNCEFIVSGDTVSVWTTRDIHTNEELFISYGDDFWK